MVMAVCQSLVGTLYYFIQPIFFPALTLASCSSTVLGKRHAQIATSAIKTPDHNTAFILPVKYQVNTRVDDITTTIAYFPFCGKTFFCVQFVKNFNGWLYNHCSFLLDLQNNKPEHKKNTGCSRL